MSNAQVQPTEPGFSKEQFSSLESMRDLVLGNLVLVGQIPAETFYESERAEFVKQRMSEYPNIDCYQDEIGNVVGVIKGKTSERKIVISASMDTRFASSLDHNININLEKASGPGVANNSLGLATLISLPEIIPNAGLELDSDIILVATTMSLGRGDLQGMRTFINNYPFNIDFVLNLTATTIGRLDHFSQSVVRADITCRVENDEEYSVFGFGQSNAIVIINELINSLLTIPLPNRPKLSMNIGKIRGGDSYSTPCPKATVNLYVRSEDDSQIQKVMENIRECCGDIGSRNQCQFDLEFFGRQHAAGLRFSHPLVKTASRIVEGLKFKPIVAPTNTQIAVPLSRGIPSITLGITTGKQSTIPNDGYIDIPHIQKGMAQVLMLLQEIDKGNCDDRS